MTLSIPRQITWSALNTAHKPDKSQSALVLSYLLHMAWTHRLKGHLRLSFQQLSHRDSGELHRTSPMETV
ncbi:hypothetical protein RRG08_013192 [Elysia crispata]|uniref:Uncharacterized protein n=1 Tax=Elysia crispata TaxID=231223 RepID=A0AAE1B4E1_9GAST|nr:hypothetical protein RRG08_013192 [Elysia crispata]